MGLVFGRHTRTVSERSLLMVLASACSRLFLGVSATHFGKSLTVLVLYQLGQLFVLGGEVVPMFGQELVPSVGEEWPGLPHLHLGKRPHITSDSFRDGIVPARGVGGILSGPCRSRIEVEVTLAPRPLDALHKSLVENVDQPIGCRI